MNHRQHVATFINKRFSSTEIKPITDYINTKLLIINNFRTSGDQLRLADGPPTIHEGDYLFKIIPVSLTGAFLITNESIKIMERTLGIGYKIDIKINCKRVTAMNLCIRYSPDKYDRLFKTQRKSLYYSIIKHTIVFSFFMVLFIGLTHRLYQRTRDYENVFRFLLPW